MSNYTLLRADRTTHLKIVAISLIAGIVVVSVGIAARRPVSDAMARIEADGLALKTSQPITWTGRETAAVR